MSSTKKPWPFAPGTVQRYRRRMRRGTWASLLEIAALMVFWAVLIGLWLGAMS